MVEGALADRSMALHPGSPLPPNQNSISTNVSLLSMKIDIPKTKSTGLGMCRARDQTETDRDTRAQCISTHYVS